MLTGLGGLHSHVAEAIATSVENMPCMLVGKAHNGEVGRGSKIVAVVAALRHAIELLTRDCVAGPPSHVARREADARSIKPGLVLP